jgi:hypothetical protein
VTPNTAGHGILDRSYGHEGVGRLGLPFLGQSYPGSVSLATNGKVSVVISSTADGEALKLVRLLG